MREGLGGFDRFGRRTFHDVARNRSLVEEHGQIDSSCLHLPDDSVQGFVHVLELDFRVVAREEVHPRGSCWSNDARDADLDTVCRDRGSRMRLIPGIVFIGIDEVAHDNGRLGVIESVLGEYVHQAEVDLVLTEADGFVIHRLQGFHRINILDHSLLVG